jgi:hypothetical protein
MPLRCAPFACKRGRGGYPFLHLPFERNQVQRWVEGSGKGGRQGLTSPFVCSVPARKRERDTRGGRCAMRTYFGPSCASFIPKRRRASRGCPVHLTCEWGRRAKGEGGEYFSRPTLCSMLHDHINSPFCMPHEHAEGGPETRGSSPVMWQTGGGALIGRGGGRVALGEGSPHLHLHTKGGRRERGERTAKHVVYALNRSDCCENY